MDDIEKKYFRMRNNLYYLEETKEEIYSKIKNTDPATFISYLKIFDYPYIEKEWNRFVKKYGEDARIFGRYVATMRLKGFQGFTFEDSNFLNSFD